MITAAVDDFLYRAKASLRRLAPVAALNRRLKANGLRSGLRRLAAHYEHRASQLGFAYDEAAAVETFQRRIAALWPNCYPKQALRVFWVGANRDQDESGFLQALRKCAEVIEFRNHKGHYGQWYWDANGRVRVHDPAIVALNDGCLLSQIDAASRSAPIDFLMGQMWANYISAGALARVREFGIPVINVSMDDRLPDNWSRRRGVRLGAVGLASATDVVLTTSSETTLWYGVEGCPALFWPLASDPNVFSPPNDAERDIDVLFIGNKYGIRETLVRSLAASGIAVTCYGGGWANGPATAEQSADLFKRARIILGVGTVGYCDDVFTLKLRDFDAPMSGALYITHRSPDLSRLYEEGREIECYSDAQECSRKIKHYLAHPSERAEIARRGHARAMARDTWLHRLRQTFGRLGLLAVEPPGNISSDTNRIIHATCR